MTFNIMLQCIASVNISIKREWPAAELDVHKNYGFETILNALRKHLTLAFSQEVRL